MTAQVTFVEGIPEDIPSLFPANCRPGILVLDDLMRNCSDDGRILDLFTKVSHHCDVTCVFDPEPFSTWKVFAEYLSECPLHYCF